MHVTGDISVWPNAAKIWCAGKSFGHFAQQGVRRGRGAPRQHPQPQLARGTGRIKLAWFLLHVARYLPPLIYATDPRWGAAAVTNHRD